MDQLNDDERALAWYSAWYPSFDGVAIVNADGTIRSANPQFCKILDVTLGQLIGVRYQDITPLPIREQDEKNAKLVMQGLTDSYLLRKTYDFGTHKKGVVLLVNRVPKDTSKPFQFFVSRIILDPDNEMNVSDSGTSSQKSGSAIYDFINKNAKAIGIALGTAIGVAFLTILDALKG